MNVEPMPSRPQSTPATLLSLRKTGVTYPGGVTALHPTTLDFAQGEFVVLLGASGAGKSTLLRTLNGLVCPTAGEVVVHDLDGALDRGDRLREHRRRTGMVFQQHHLIGRQTVLANVLLGQIGSIGFWSGLRPRSEQDKEQALAALARVGLLDKALQRADTLSGGQQQRVGIARALVQKPRLMLADEPVASLDPASAQVVLTLLHDICKEKGLTAVVSLHQVDLARRFADRLIGISSGRVAFDGPPGEFDSVQAAIYTTTAPRHSLVPEALPTGFSSIPSLESF